MQPVPGRGRTSVCEEAREHFSNPVSVLVLAKRKEQIECGSARM